MPHRAFGGLFLLVVVALLLAARSVLAQDGPPLAPADGPSPASTDDLSATVDHPLVPLAMIPTKIFTGEQLDAKTGNRIAIRTEENVLPGATHVAGFAVTVVSVQEYLDGEFVDAAADYYAQGVDGTVYYIGERVNQVEDGEIVSHDDTWLSGEQGAQPGVFMPADPVIGETFMPEQLPDVAIEQSTVIAVDQVVTVPAGTFEGCVVTQDIGLPLRITEKKTYCSGVGLVQEEFLGGHLELVQFETAS